MIRHAEIFFRPRGAPRNPAWLLTVILTMAAMTLAMLQLACRDGAMASSGVITLSAPSGVTLQLRGAPVIQAGPAGYTVEAPAELTNGSTQPLYVLISLGLERTDLTLGKGPANLRVTITHCHHHFLFWDWDCETFELCELPIIVTHLTHLDFCEPELHISRRTVHYPGMQNPGDPAPGPLPLEGGGPPPADIVVGVIASHDLQRIAQALDKDRSKFTLRSPPLQPGVTVPLLLRGRVAADPTPASATQPVTPPSFAIALADDEGHDSRVLFAPAANAVTAVADGNWNNPSTWSSAAIPAASDTVTIPNGITVTVPSSYTVTINSGGSVTVDSGGALINLNTIHNKGTLSVNGGTNGTGFGPVIGPGSIDNRSTIDNKHGGTIIVNGGDCGAGSGEIVNQSTGTIDNKTGGTIIVNDGTNTCAPMVFASGPGLIANQLGGIIDNEGTITLNGEANHCGNTAGGGTIVNGGTFNNKGKGTINNDGGTIDNTATFTSSGGAAINNGTTTTGRDGIFYNSSGTFINSSNSKFNNYGAVVVYGGLFNINANCKFTNFNGAIFTLGGTLGGTCPAAAVGC